MGQPGTSCKLAFGTQLPHFEEALGCGKRPQVLTRTAPAEGPPDAGRLRARGSVSEGEVVQSCPTLFDLMDCSLPGSSLHGVFQARVLEWFAISFSRGSSHPRDRSQVSRIVGRRFTVLATREDLIATASKLF